MFLNLETSLLLYKVIKWFLLVQLDYCF